MPSWTKEAYAKAMGELWEHRRKAVLHSLLHRFVVETGKSDEFLRWLAKDMGLDESMDLTRVDALIEQIEHSRAVGQSPSP